MEDEGVGVRDGGVFWGCVFCGIGWYHVYKQLSLKDAN